MTEPPSRKSFLVRLATTYECTSFAYFVRAIEPLGILFAAIGVLVAAVGLAFAALAVWLAAEEIEQSRELHEATLREFEANRQLRAATLDEFRQSRALRKTTLSDMLIEQFAAARAEDSGRSATRTMETPAGYRFRRCHGPNKQLRAEVGQIQILEQMNENGIDLEAIDANGVNFQTGLDPDGEAALSGIKLGGGQLVDAHFREANLAHADFRGAELDFARFGRSCLKRAQFPGAVLPHSDFVRADATGAAFSNVDLSSADLTSGYFARANFAGADLTNADLTSAYLQSTEGLTQQQLDQACANSNRNPPLIPTRLRWKTRDCP